MKFKIISLLFFMSVFGLGDSIAAEPAVVKFRTLGWDISATVLTLMIGEKQVPVSLEPRVLSSVYSGPNLLRFSAGAGTEAGTLDFEVVVPDGISSALLLFRASVSKDKAGYEVTVLDDSLAAFPLNRIRCINLAAFPIKVELQDEAKILAPEMSAMWAELNSRRTRLSLSLQRESGWKEFSNSTLDLMAGKRLNVLTFSDASPVAVETLGDDGSPRSLLIYPEKRQAYWFTIWDKGQPETTGKAE